MSPKRRWSLLALGSLSALVFVGSWGCCSVTCCDKKPRNQLVLVLDGDKPSIDPIVISKDAGHEIVWKLPAESTITYVAITLSGKPVPFVACDTTEGICRIACQDGLCSSGAVNPALDPPKGGVYYDYVFAHSGGGASADPGFRIDP
jgi:hypothetical protein